jgi:integrase
MYSLNVSGAFKKVLRKCGIRDIRFHDLRHTHASILIRATVDILTIIRMLGHARASITLDVYGHLIPGRVETSVKWHERLLPYLSPGDA